MDKVNKLPPLRLAAVPATLLYPDRLPSLEEVTRNLGIETNNRGLQLQSESNQNYLPEYDNAVVFAATTLFNMRNSWASSSDSAIRVETSSTKSDETSNLVEHSPLLELDQGKLWAQFYHHQNEMIITKNGRCLFPILKFQATEDLDDETYYSFFVDVVPVVNQKLKYRNRTWSVSNMTRRFKADRQSDDDSNESTDTSDCHQSFGSYNFYLCDDGIQSGQFWKANGISFQRMKLTNRVRNTAFEVMDSRDSSRLFDNFPNLDYTNHLFPLQSFRHFQPRVHLVEHPRVMHPVRNPSPSHYACNTRVLTHIFIQCQFIAVTHYQNQQINALKKVFNPHAKSFKELIPSKLLPSGNDFPILPPTVFETDLMAIIREGIMSFTTEVEHRKRTFSEGEEDSYERIKRNKRC
jgi:hypothetical protein